MVKRKRTNNDLQKKLHRKVKIKQHKLHSNMELNWVLRKNTVPVPLAVVFVVLLNDTKII
jgi:hypothetical protein